MNINSFQIPSTLSTDKIMINVLFQYPDPPDELK